VSINLDVAIQNELTRDALDVVNNAVTNLL